MSINQWLARAGLVVLTGALGACGAGTSPVAVSGSAATSEPGAATPASSASVADFGSQPAAAKSSTPPVLTGKRQVTMVRVGSFESGLSLTDAGRLAEVDDDSGRQLFVPTPLGGQKFLIKAYARTSTGPLCWRAHNPGNQQPLIVRAAACKAEDARQQFEILATNTGGTQSYLISIGGAYLRHSSRSGLILEELGDAPPTSSFRFIDNGPAPAAR
ncbi:hypothetical protein C5N14_30290 [Micromonospora sp. MW-13]|uniref:hypothetical protein n=1 Tax=unclassified Micromonospora TaxID=2617518 RepID=UPI000E448387|nr:MULTISPECIES: hypothetical protein [unclassified Micromonospora]MCX4469481.1 hypothetical protein [Micromonospora sp. NBC_01655]RGC65150.1 hypothetical protein C5N14_30290 [Micromonospora sp. MW-13]